MIENVGEEKGVEIYLERWGEGRAAFVVSYVCETLRSADAMLAAYAVNIGVRMCAPSHARLE